MSVNKLENHCRNIHQWIFFHSHLCSQGVSVIIIIWQYLITRWKRLILGVFCQLHVNTVWLWIGSQRKGRWSHLFAFEHLLIYVTLTTTKIYVNVKPWAELLYVTTITYPKFTYIKPPKDILTSFKNFRSF